MGNTRRDFLQKVGASAVALQLASITSWGAKKENYDGPVLRVAILGLVIMLPALLKPCKAVLKLNW